MKLLPSKFDDYEYNRLLSPAMVAISRVRIAHHANALLTCYYSRRRRAGVCHRKNAASSVVDIFTVANRRIREVPLTQGFLVYGALPEPNEIICVNLLRST